MASNYQVDYSLINEAKDRVKSLLFVRFRAGVATQNMKSNYITKIGWITQLELRLQFKVRPLYCYSKRADVPAVSLFLPNDSLLRHLTSAVGYSHSDFHLRRFLNSLQRRNDNNFIMVSFMLPRNDFNMRVVFITRGDLQTI